MHVRILVVNGSILEELWYYTVNYAPNVTDDDVTLTEDWANVHSYTIALKGTANDVIDVTSCQSEPVPCVWVEPGDVTGQCSTT